MEINSLLHSGMRQLLLLGGALLLSACSMLMPAKPVMSVEQGITVYTIDKYAIDKKSAPTVLMFSGCGGTQTQDVKDILPRKAQWLNAHGFNAVVFDYVKIMGLDNACYGQVKVDTLIKAALDAFTYTASQPFVERDRIAVLGWSMGASMALAVAQKTPIDTQPTIAAAAAYYPGCYPELQLSSHPTLLLLGLADNVVDPNACLALAKRSPQTPLTLKTYADAQHNFDVVEFKQPRTTHFLWKTFTSAYDSVAAADAENILLDFLDKNLKQK